MQNQAKSSEIEPNHAKLHQIMGNHRKPRKNRQNPAKQLETTLTSVQADNQYVSVSADILVIGWYIGFADKQNAYRYWLSVSADKEGHIGWVTGIL